MQVIPARIQAEVTVVNTENSVINYLKNQTDL